MKIQLLWEGFVPIFTSIALLYAISTTLLALHLKEKRNADFQKIRNSLWSINPLRLFGYMLNIDKNDVLLLKYKIPYVVLCGLFLIVTILFVVLFVLQAF